MSDIMKTIGQCARCGENLTNGHVCPDVKLVQVDRVVMPQDVLMRKMGPCPLCGDHIKPCRCRLEEKIKGLKNSLNNCLFLLENYSGTNAETAVIELAIKRLEDKA